jgi:hypothetical protein
MYRSFTRKLEGAFKRLMGNFRKTIKLLTMQLFSVPELTVRIRGQRIFELFERLNTLIDMSKGEQADREADSQPHYALGAKKASSNRQQP